MRQLSLFIGCSLFAPRPPSPSPTPPVAAAPARARQGRADDPGQAARASPRHPAPRARKTEKWDVNARHGPGRDVAIDTRRGTWMSLDVSPDGREIAFDLLGDLYVIPIEGGEARAISTGHAWDMQPRYSPDGQEIAFTSDRGGGDNIWTIRRDGSAPRQITKEDFRLLNQADWTPDGNFIVARKHFTSARSLGAGEMWLYHRGGGDKGAGVQMTKARTKQKDTNEPAFSPDGRYLYFSDDATPGDTFQYSKDVNGQIYVIQRLDRQTGEIETLVDGPGGAIRPTPSPDGKSLAFIRRVRYKSTLMLMDLKSGRITPLTDILDRDMQETWAVHGVYPGMSWTPDSKSIVFWAKGGIHRVDVASKAVSEIPFHVTGTRFVEDAVRQQKEVAPASFKTRMVRFAQKSPDGSRIVYEALGNIWIADGSGNNPRRLTRGDEFESYPTFSRDGRSIAYVAWDDDKAGRIKVVGVGGGEGRIVTPEPGHYVEPAFSPDGSLIAYRKTSDGFLTTPLYGRDPGLYVVPVKGGTPKRVAKKGTQPMFGATNDRIFFTATGEEEKRLLKSVSIHGTEEVTHLISQNAADFALSPDEQFVAWTERYQAYVMPFVRSGRSIDIAPDGKALPQSQAQRRCRRLDPLVGQRPHPLLEPGPQPLRPESRHGGRLRRRQAGRGAAGRRAGRRRQSGQAHRQHRADRRADRHHARRRGDREWHGPDRGRPHRRGRADGQHHLSRRHAHHRRQRQDDHPRPDRRPLARADGQRADHPQAELGPCRGARLWRDHGPRSVATTRSRFSPRPNIRRPARSSARASSRPAPSSMARPRPSRSRSTAWTTRVSHLRRLQASGAWSVKSYNQPRREQRQMVIQAARQLGMEVVPEGGSLFEHNMTMIADGHTTIEHSLPVANIYDDVLQFWRGCGHRLHADPGGGLWRAVR